MASRPRVVVDCSCAALRDWKIAREVSSEVIMVSRPDISSSSTFFSCVSAFPRTVPTAFDQKPWVGVSAILCCSCVSLCFLSLSMSLVASRPACLRLMSVSERGLGLAPKFCHIELTEAKPDRRPIRETPVTPSRSRQALTIFPWLLTASFMSFLYGRSWPIDQNPRRNMPYPTTSSTHARCSLPIPFPPLNFHPHSAITEYSSSSGMAMMSSPNRLVTVNCKAKRRATGLKEFEISQSSSSVSTTDNAIVVENTKREMRFVEVIEAFCEAMSLLDPLRGSVRSWKEGLPLEEDAVSSGKIFCATKISKPRNVMMKGKAEKAVGTPTDRLTWVGVQSTQFSNEGDIGWVDR